MYITFLSVELWLVWNLGKFPKVAEAFKSSCHFILGVRLAINHVGTKCRMGEGNSGVARLNLNHQDSSAGLVFWWASCSHSSTIYIEKQQQEGGRGERWASALVRVGCEWEAKAYQNTKEVRSFIRAYAPVHWYVLPPACFGSVYLTQSI